MDALANRDGMNRSPRPSQMQWRRRARLFSPRPSLKGEGAGVRDASSLRRAGGAPSLTPGPSPFRSGRARGVVVALLAWVILAAPAYATGGGGSSCNATIGTISAIPTVVYDPFDGVSASVIFTVEAVNQSSEPCNLSLAIESAGSSSTRYFRKVSDKLRYVVEDTDGDDYENDIDEPRGWHSLQGGVGKTKIITVKVKVPSGLISPAGNYSNTLSLRLYRAGGSALGTVRTATANALVEERAQVNIAGASGSWGAWSVDELDFNNLNTGETRSARVQVRATTGVTIHVVSQNKGKLKHNTLAALVPYAMKLNNVTMMLDPGPAETDVAPPVSLDGSSYPMVVTIGDVSGRPSGTYKDLLTITVTPE
jgi:hypothetical protein